MEENIESTPAITVGAAALDSRPQNAGGALVSALLPGAGQFILGEKIKGAVFLSLFAIWNLLFFPPVRLPRLYWGWLFLVLSGIILTIVSGCLALRSKKEERSPGSWIWLAGILPLGLVIPLLLQSMLVRAGGFEPFYIPSESMEPTIHLGDTLMADMRFYPHYQPADGDIIIFKSPNTPGVKMVKRLIAKGGDTIMSVDGQVTLNGKVLEENYAEHTGNPPDDLMNFGPLKIPPHKLFFMGDNRDLSLDSRTQEFGLVDESAILGKPLYIIRPGRDRSGERIH